MKRFFILMLVLAASTVFAEDTDFHKAFLQERLDKIQIQYNLGKTMMEKAQLEYNSVQAELNQLNSKPTDTKQEKKK